MGRKPGAERRHVCSAVQLHIRLLKLPRTSWEQLAWKSYTAAWRRRRHRRRTGGAAAAAAEKLPIPGKSDYSHGGKVMIDVPATMEEVLWVPEKFPGRSLADSLRIFRLATNIRHSLIRVSFFQLNEQKLRYYFVCLYF